MKGYRGCLIACATIVLLLPTLDAKGQGVAFQPVVGAIPNGPVLNVTPAVSLDRRYVRLGVNPQFIAVEGFNSYLVPAAVGGGPGGPGALGGGQFLAGMNGVIGPAAQAGFLNGNMPGSDGFAGGMGMAGATLPWSDRMAAGPRFRPGNSRRAGVSKAHRSGRSPWHKK